MTQRVVSPNGQAALDYATHFGWAVFPLHTPRPTGCTCGKPKCANLGKHPRTRHGLKDATTDPRTITHWWSAWPDANIGVALGTRSGVIAVDVDPRHGGDVTLADLEAKHGPLPETVEAVTGGGGRHVLFTCPEGGCPTRDLGPGLELRGDGAYIVVAPSVHPSGRQYQWEAAHHLGDVPLAPLPPWVLSLAKPQSGHKAAPGAKLDPAKVLAGVPEGQRDVTLFKFACRLRAKGLTREEAEVLVLEAARRCQPPFPENEALEKVVNAWKYPSGEAHLKAALLSESDSEAAAASDANSRKLPMVVANRRQLRDVAADALAAVLAANAPPVIFQRGSTWVRLRRDGQGAAIMETMTDDAVRGHLARVADWFQEKGEGDKARRVDVFPPVAVVRDLLSLPDVSLPRLTAVVRSPVFVPDGSLVATPGYHSAARLFVDLPSDFLLPTVPVSPTVEEIRRARALLLDELLVEFPFAEEGSKANAVAMILLPFIRAMIDGPTPLHLVEAPLAGTGKSLLVEVAGVVAGETTPAVMTEKGGWGNGPDEAEWRKAITSVLLAGKQIVRIDNVRNALDSAQLSAALTCRVWQDRILGHSREVSVPVTCVWVGTGNNVMLSTEMARRTVSIRLDARMDRPWERQGWRHELPAWAIDNRPELVWACLTVVQAWIAAGRPVDPAVPVLGSYPAWTRTMGGILKVAGIPGFLGNLNRLYECADAESGMWRQFIEDAWWPTYAGTEVATRDLRTLAADSDMLGTILGQGDERSQTTKLGKALGKLRDRVFGGYRIEPGEPDHSRRATWRLLAVGSPVPRGGSDGQPSIGTPTPDAGRRGADNLCTTSAPALGAQDAGTDSVSASSAEVAQVAEVAEVLRGSAAIEEFLPTDGQEDAIFASRSIGIADTVRGGNCTGALTGESTSAPLQNAANACNDANGWAAEVPQRLTTSALTSAGEDFGDLNEVRL